MRKLKMFGVGLAAAALVFMITAGQWNSDVSKSLFEWACLPDPYLIPI
jgi:hypothetical protein